MATNRAITIQAQVAIFHCPVIINDFNKRIAFGAARTFQNTLLLRHRNSAPKQCGLSREFLFAHAQEYNGLWLRFNR